MDNKSFSTPLEQDDRQQIGLIRALLGITLLATVAIYFLQYTNNQNIYAPSNITIAASAIATVISFVLVMMKIITPVRYSLPAILIISITLVAFNADGSHDIAILAYPVVITLGAMLLGLRGIFIFTPMSMIGVGFLTFTELYGYAPNPRTITTEPADGFIVWVLYATFGAILYFMINQLYQSLRTARLNEQLQLEANRELRLLQEQLEERVTERTQQLTASIEVAKAASETRSTDELLKKVVNLITDQFGYYYAAIFLVADNGRWAELVEATGTAGQVLRARKHRLAVGGASMVGAAISAQEPRIALDVGDEPVRFNNPLLPNTRSEIALPLIVSNNVIGALDVQSTREADFGPEDISTLQSLASQVAIALTNAQLFEQMNSALDELRELNRDYISSGWMGRTVSEQFEASARQAGISDEDLREVEIDLKLRDENIGKILLEKPGEWSEEDQAWVEALASQVAYSLENARLVEDSQQSALRERISSSIIQKLWSSSSIESIMQTTVREMARALDASEATIELTLEEGKGNQNA